ncbi:MAG: tetratricopeptide repeat protein [Pirellulaceae bacterium]
MREPLCKRALEIYQLTLGEQHSDYAACVNDLACVYQAQGDYAEVPEPLYKQALEITKAALGEQHQLCHQHR